MFSAIVNPDFKTNQNKTDPKSPLIVTQLTKSNMCPIILVINSGKQILALNVSHLCNHSCV